MSDKSKILNKTMTYLRSLLTYLYYCFIFNPIGRFDSVIYYKISQIINIL